MVWGSDRPLTLVWLAVDWGQGEREIIGADRRRAQSRRTALDQPQQAVARTHAEFRGQPRPAGRISAARFRRYGQRDVQRRLGRFRRALSLRHPQRYDVSSVLIGRVRAGTESAAAVVVALCGEQQNWAGRARSHHHAGDGPARRRICDWWRRAAAKRVACMCPA